MRDPTIAMDGYTYEREAIEAYMNLSPLSILPVSPVTELVLLSRKLLPNRLVRDVIQHLGSK